MRLHADRSGAGAHGVLLVHPHPMDRCCWLHQQASFGRWATTLAVDLPGYGLSPPLEGPTTVDAVAEACWRVVDEHGLGAPVLVGSSVGSFVALRMALQRPEGPAALILTGTGYIPDKAFVDERVAGYRAKGVAYRDEHARSLVVPAFLASERGRYLLGLSVSPRTPSHVESVISLLEMVRTADSPQDYAAVVVPTLVVSGVHDTAHDGARRTASMIPGARLEVIAAAAHLCHLERPEVFDRAVERFLAELGLLDAHGPLGDAPE